MQLAFNVNGQAERVEADPRETLLAVLRDRLGLVGSKYGCGEGECGACTVLINGRPVTSCMTLAGQVNAQDVMTIEGMPEDPVGMHVVQAFAEAGSVQCGFCTPGFVLATRHLLQHNPETDREAVRAQFLKFASDITAAETRRDLVRVLANVDKYVDAVVKATG